MSKIFIVTLILEFILCVIFREWIAGLSLSSDLRYIQFELTGGFVLALGFISGNLLGLFIWFLFIKVIGLIKRKFET